MQKGEVAFDFNLQINPFNLNWNNFQSGNRPFMDPDSRITHGYHVSTDKILLDRDRIFNFLTNHSYWAAGRERSVFDTSVEHSLCFGLYGANNEQAGFARIITDFAVYAYILDLFIFESHRGKGLSKMLLTFILAFPDLRPVKKWTLATRDAHGLYEQFGFTPLKNPEKHMERTG
jgi:GNAT superfamily N-acetyltransferase